MLKQMLDNRDKRRDKCVVIQRELNLVRRVESIRIGVLRKKRIRRSVEVNNFFEVNVGRGNILSNKSELFSRKIWDSVPLK